MEENKKQQQQKDGRDLSVLVIVKYIMKNA